MEDILAEKRKFDRKWLAVKMMKRPWLFFNHLDSLFLDKIIFFNYGTCINEM